MSKASKVERLMLDLINEARADAGLDPLQLARALNTSAEDHSAWMLRTDRFSHTGAGSSRAGDRMEDAGFDFTGSWSWGENIAWQSERGRAGIGDDVRDLFQSLMNSPGHRANILSARYDYVGIGVETGAYKGWDAVMVTQNFASTGARVALDTGGSGGSGATTASSGPRVGIDDITVAAVRGRAKRADVEDYLNMSNADRDEIVFYEVRDEAGRHSFVLRGEGKINARDGYVLEAAAMEDLRVRRDLKLGESSLEIRASDGEDWGDWVEFSLNTVSAEDYFA